VRNASLITGINRLYYEGMLERNPQVRNNAALAEMPYGGSERDHEYVRQNSREARLFTGHQGKFNLIYAGAMLPNGYDVLEQLLASLVLLRKERPNLDQEFHLHFVGTGKSPSDPNGFNIRPLLERHRLEDCATEYPQRLPYLDVLTHLHAASGVLIVGSTEPHYSPSKVFQAVMSRRPVFALLHEQSSATPMLKAANAGPVITLAKDALPSTERLARALHQFIFNSHYSEPDVNWKVLETHSARESARALAVALDHAVAGTRAHTVDRRAL
jgi:hypothetical protein